MSFTSNPGPIGHFTGIVDIKPNRLTLEISDTPEAFAYTIWGSKSINDLYGNPAGSGVGGVAGGRTALFNVNKGTYFQSRTIMLKKWAMTGQIFRGTTMAMIDLNDFITPVNPQPLPLPNSMLFLRLQQSRFSTGGPAVVTGVTNNGEPIMGPIVVVPPYGALGMPDTTINFGGTAPILANSQEGDIPLSSMDPAMQNDPYPMGIVLHRPSTSITLQNLDSDNDLLYSFDWEMPYIRLPAGEKISSFGSVKYLILGSLTGAIDWNVTADLAMGLGA